MKENKRKKSTKYLLIGTLVLFLSVLGASVAYYLARVQGNLSGRAAGTELTINVEKLSSKATGDLIPLDNDLETLQLAAAGYQDKGACVDINGYSVCQIYKITVTNNGSVPLTMNGTVTLSGQNTPNIDCATMTNETTVANNNSCMSGMFVQGDTLAANSHNDYYVMVYINNLDEPQYDSGEFNGTVTFTSEDGKMVKGRFTKPFNLVQRIQTLYNVNNNDLVTTTTKDEVVNNEITYNYATNVGLMNDRLGGATVSLDGGNIRYYGAEPNNYIDIGDRIEEEVIEKSWEKYGESFGDITECEEYVNGLDNFSLRLYLQGAGVSTKEELCSVTTIPAGTPILWRIIGIFDNKLRIVRNEGLNYYVWDTSASNINDGKGINEWSQADIMKLFNPGYEHNQDKDSEGNDITVNNSLWWNSEKGVCYNDNGNRTIECDFTNDGLSEGAKDYIIDQTVYLGGFDTINFFSNEAYEMERESNVIQNPSDNITRTLSWTGKVALMSLSDFGYATDFGDSNCQGDLKSFYNKCSKNWMLKGINTTISPYNNYAYGNLGFIDYAFGSTNVSSSYFNKPTLLLDSSVLAETGNGSREHPYVLTQ